MKKLLIVLLVLGSFSVFANETIDNIGKFSIVTRSDITFKPGQKKTNFFDRCDVVLENSFDTKKKISGYTLLEPGKIILKAPSSGVWFRVVIPITNKQEIKSINCSLQSSGWLSQNFSKAPTIEDFLVEMQRNFIVKINNNHDELK